MAILTTNPTDDAIALTAVISDALVLIGGLEDDETPTAPQFERAKRTLHRMIRAWSAKPLKVWAEQDVELDLVASQSAYTIGPGGDLDMARPIRISNVRRVVSGIETEIRQVSRQEYLTQPSKDSEGYPVFVYYDAQIEQGVLHVWPAPQSADKLRFSARAYIEDFSNLASEPNFPAEWGEAIVYNLALRLCPMYEVTGEDRAYIAQMATQFLQEAEDSDLDEGSVFLTPERML